MDGNDLIAMLNDNFSVLMGPVNVVVGALISTILLRHDTSTTEFEKIKAGQFKEVADELLKTGKMTYSEYYRAKNFLSIAKKADEYIDDKKKIDDKKYDFDFFIRLYDDVGSVSNEKLQDWWAKLLAGEVSNPTSFSYKTLDVMKNISQRDAELFEKVCMAAVLIDGRNFALPHEKEYLQKKGIRYADLMYLEELGLIFKDSGINLEIPISKNLKVICMNNSLALTISSASGKEEKTNILQYPFTVAGSELARIVNKNATDEDFIEYAKLLNKDSRYNVGVHKILDVTEDKIYYADANCLE